MTRFNHIAPTEEGPLLRVKPQIMRFLLDGRPLPFEQGDSVLTAILRREDHPTAGGTLCLAGDCPNCLCTVDGVSYIRTCQVKAVPGLVVERHPDNGLPPLPSSQQPPAVPHPIRYLFCQAAVVYLGECAEGEEWERRARSEGRTVERIDSREGREVVGIYAGPLLLVRCRTEMLHIRVAEELVVATGAAEILPVVPGSELRGLYTARAAVALSAAGLDLAEMVAVGRPPHGLNCRAAEGELVRFEGEHGRVKAVVTRDESGRERSHSCRNVCVNLGTHPRNQLALMASDLPLRVTVLGEASDEATIPPCPRTGLVCPCEGVTMDDLEHTWDSGFQEMELIKRSTLAGTGACQGMGCLPYLRSFLKEKTGTLSPRFTARPVVRQLTLEEIAAGAHLPADLRTPLHQEHLAAGARMERFSSWWRPWNYGDVKAEYWAVREGVSVMDVSTLGKFIVSGPDSLAFLERVYPTRVKTIKEGRSRYALLLDERGYVFDDGLISKESDTRYHLTFTSGGASHAEMWLRDWAQAWSMNVRIMNLTFSRAAINVTGPLASDLLQRMGAPIVPFLAASDTQLAGIPCRIFRLSFTGEVSYELHHSADRSVELWRALLEQGSALNIRPHGLEALQLLRLEKGHLMVHQDTDFDSTPRRLQCDSMICMEKEQFLGRPALVRTDRTSLDKMLVGLTMEGEPPFEGATLRHQGEYAGFVTSAGYSPALQQSVMLAHLHLFENRLPERVMIDGREAVRVTLPFYDKPGVRARA